tara:strand:+ start:1392 stop:2774 length:1383 start_codon:yes stop_codon:yes gene_type:complete
MSRRIAVVGASAAGFVQLASLQQSKYRLHSMFKDDEYVLIHDPDKVYNEMMSGTNPAFFDDLQVVTNLTKRWMEKYADARDCHGYKYIGWGQGNKNFQLSFHSQTAEFIDIEMFRNEMLKDGGQCFGNGVKIIEQQIDSVVINESGAKINGEFYDFVIDCTEKNPLFDPHAFGDPSLRPVNTAIILEKPEAGHWDYCIEYAGKYGHMTGIPLKSRQLWIYMYDSVHRKDTTDEEIMKDIQDAFPDDDVSTWKFKKRTWVPRVSNYCVCPHTGRYIRNGAALIDIMPLTATHNECVHIMCDSIGMYTHLINEKEKGRQKIVNHIEETYYELLAMDYQAMLSFMYMYGSRFNTKFWKNIKAQAREYLSQERYLHPSFFPGKPWLDEVLNDKWTDEDYKALIHSDEEDDVSGRHKVVPFVIMNDRTLFSELATGLGAPYADRFSALDYCYPPEKFGTIGYKTY